MTVCMSVFDSESRVIYTKSHLRVWILKIWWKLLTVILMNYNLLAEKWTPIDWPITKILALSFYFRVKLTTNLQLIVDMIGR